MIMMVAPLAFLSPLYVMNKIPEEYLPMGDALVNIREKKTKEADPTAPPTPGPILLPAKLNRSPGSRRANRTSQEALSAAEMNDGLTYDRSRPARNPTVPPTTSPTSPLSLPRPTVAASTPSPKPTNPPSPKVRREEPQVFVFCAQHMHLLLDELVLTTTLHPALSADQPSDD